MARDNGSENGTSSYGTVEHEAYCMPSMQKRNVDEMNTKSGYLDMSDLANTKRFPVEMDNKPGVRKNVQPSPALPNPRHNDRSE